MFSSNVSALSASGKVVQLGNYTLANLSATIKAQVFPTKPCPASTPLLSGGKCIGCPAGQHYDLKSRTCYKPKFASNVTQLLQSKRAVPVGNHTLGALNSSIVSSPYPSVPCPRAAPLFNGSACTFCPLNSYYLLNNLTCYYPKLISNVTALNATGKVLPFNGVTLQTVMARQKKLVLPVIACPKLFPLFNGTNCVACPNGTYYLLSNDRCYTPKNVSNVDYLLKNKNFINVGNSTLSSLNATITASKYPVHACSASTPVFNGTNCFACPRGSYYFLNNFTCYQPKNVSNVSALATGHRYISRPNHTLLTI